mmetsp:Transcript_14137/g.41490  ORF Transcript_14137/g.41490 Transcript_14137/m.41490 type:complete len:238 (-) Transcript_14137:231-944(-)
MRSATAGSCAPHSSRSAATERCGSAVSTSCSATQPPCDSSSAHSLASGLTPWYTSRNSDALTRERAALRPATSSKPAATTSRTIPPSLPSRTACGLTSSSPPRGSQRASGADPPKRSFACAAASAPSAEPSAPARPAMARHAETALAPLSSIATSGPAHARAAARLSCGKREEACEGESDSTRSSETASDAAAASSSASPRSARASVVTNATVRSETGSKRRPVRASAYPSTLSWRA